MFIVFLLSQSGTRFWGLFGRPLFGGLSPLLTHFIALGQINKLLAAFCLISFERAPNIYHSLNKFCSAAVCSVRQCSLKRCARVLFRQQFSLLTLLVMLMRGPTDGRTDGRTDQTSDSIWNWVWVWSDHCCGCCCRRERGRKGGATIEHSG